MKVFLILIIFFPNILAGQGKYKHIYKIQLKNQPSTYSTQIIDTFISDDKCILNFILQGNKGDSISYANVKIKNTKTEKLIYSDMNGLVSIELTSDTFDISITSLFFTSIYIRKKIIEKNTKIIFTCSLGMSNSKMIGNICSKRKLTESEINKIVDDLSNGIEETELIKNKTCHILWDI